MSFSLPSFPALSYETMQNPLPPLTVGSITVTPNQLAGALAAVPVLAVAYRLASPYLARFRYGHVKDLKGAMNTFEGEFLDKAGGQDKRKALYTNTTESFYNLITDFYEYGWGQSFHFAPRYKEESFEASILRYEHYVAAQLNVPTPWDALPKQFDKMYRVLDVGCGIGGPMRAIAKFFKYQVRITGVNITAEHIVRAEMFNERFGVKNCDFIRSDFNHIPVPDNTFDAIYDFEATLHSTDTETTFRELLRVLKPGGRCVTAQYCLIGPYSESNENHKDIIRRVDNTNGCYVAHRTPAITTAALTRSGFKILSMTDVFSREAGSDIDFHEVFESTKGQRFTGTKLGLYMTYAFCYLGELLRLLPRGTAQVQEMLMGAADSFKEAGREGILTPGMLYVLEKPAH